MVNKGGDSKAGEGDSGDGAEERDCVVGVDKNESEIDTEGGCWFFGQIQKLRPLIVLIYFVS